MVPILQTILEELHLPVGQCESRLSSSMSDMFESEQGRKKWTAQELSTVFKKLFKVEMPKPATSNPRKEASLVMRYMVVNVLKNDNIKQCFKNACAQTVAFVKKNPYTLVEDGQQVTSADGVTVLAAAPIKKGGYVRGTGKTGRKKGAKQEKAAEIFAKNKTLETKELVKLFMKELDMSKAGATTYVYNCRKAAGMTSTKRGKKAKAK